MNESNGHEQEKYVCLWIRREDNRHSNRRRIMMWQGEYRMWLQVVWSAKRKYAPGSLVPSCHSERNTIIWIKRSRFIFHDDVHLARQGRQQRIVCVKDLETNKLQLKLAPCSSRVEPRVYTPLQHMMLRGLFFFL